MLLRREMGYNVLRLVIINYFTLDERELESWDIVDFNMLDLLHKYL